MTSRKKAKSRPTTKAPAKQRAKSTPRRSVSSSKSTSRASKSSSSARGSQTLRIRHESEYLGNDWWNWSIWLDAPPDELKNVQYVEYQLHPTFSKPIRRRKDPKTKFRLSSSGWGEFEIGVEIKRKGAAPLRRRHWLSLEYPAVTLVHHRAVSKSGEKRPTIFLSGSVSDLGLLTHLARALEDQGVEVIRMDDAPPDLPWDGAIKRMLTQADMMVMVISGSLTSWATREIDAALSLKLPILPIALDANTEIPESLRTFQAIHQEGISDPAKLAPVLAEQIKKLT